MSSVLLCSYSGALGGAERVLLDVAEGFGEQAILACPAGPLADAARARGIRNFHLRWRALELRSTPTQSLSAVRDLVGHGREVRRLTRDLGPELVVVWNMRSALGVCFAASPPVRTVFAHNDLLPGGLIAAAVRRAARRADLVITPSRVVADDLSLPDHVVVNPPGVEMERFATTGPIPDGAPSVLVLGALVRWKRPGLAVEALALARRQVPDLRLRLVGGALGVAGEKLSDELRAQADAAGLAEAFELVGQAADPILELARASCLLHCAPREPFGLVVVEALAAGRPAVVPEAGGPAEIIDPSCGRLYPPGDAAGAAGALVELVSTPGLAAQLGERGRRRAGERFSAPEASARWVAAARGPARSDGPRAAPGAGLSIVTVTHDSASHLERLLACAARHLPAAQVVVVDSGSRDDSPAIARRAGAETIELGINAGFGAGSNRGVAAAREGVTVLLNPDVELLDDSLLELAEVAGKGPDCLLVPLVLNSDGSRQDTAHPLPSSPADLIRSLVPPSSLPRALAAWLDPWRSRRRRTVGWAVGCAVMARTATLRELGPFDERIFLYGEDLDLALHARQAGIPTIFLPSARVIHHGAHTSTLSFGGEPFTELARARHVVVRRRLGPARARLDWGTQATTFASRGLLKRLTGRSAARERRQLRALSAVDRG